MVKGVRDSQQEGQIGENFPPLSLVIICHGIQLPSSRVYFYPIADFSIFFSFRYELHVIVDEIYMLSVFDDSVSFHSVLEMDR